RQDAPHRVRPLRGGQPARPGRRATRELRLSRLHAQLRKDAEGEVHGAAADGAHEVAGEAEGGEARASAASARVHPGGRSLSALGRWGSRAVLRGSHEREQHRRLPDGYRLALAAGPQAPQPDAPSVVGTDGAIHRPVASTRAYLSPLSPRPLRRCHPRQEPDAVMPHVRICGGGYEQSSSLLRLSSDWGGGPPYPPSAHRSSLGLDRDCPRHYIRPASSSAASKSVLAPYSMSSMGVNSSSQWLRPPRDGTKIMPVGPIAAMY